MELTGTSGVQGTKITQTNRMMVILTALVAFISVSMLSSCGSTHKMSKVEHVVLPTTVLSSPRAFPQEIADSLGWGAMYEGTLGEEEEEFRGVLSSPISPYHGLRIKKTKDIEISENIYINLMSKDVLFVKNILLKDLTKSAKSF